MQPFLAETVAQLLHIGYLHTINSHRGASTWHVCCFSSNTLNLIPDNTVPEYLFALSPNNESNKDRYNRVWTNGRPPSARTSEK